MKLVSKKTCQMNHFGTIGRDKFHYLKLKRSSHFHAFKVFGVIGSDDGEEKTADVEKNLLPSLLI